MGFWEAVDAYRGAMGRATAAGLSGGGDAGFCLRAAALETAIACRAAVHAVISIYRALLAGAPVAQIAEVTGLSPDQVAARRAERADGQIRLREWAGTGMTREEYGRTAAAAAGADGRPGVVSFGFRRLCRRARACRFAASLIAPRLREERTYMRALRVAPCRQLALDLGELSGQDRWEMLPERARMRVLTLLAAMIAGSALAGPGHQDGDRGE
jgi:hypothetical protein